LQLFAVYKLLLAKSLYHRYHATVNGTRGAVSMPIDLVAADLAESSSALTSDAARSAVLAMSYGPSAKRAGVDPVYFSLFHLAPSDEVVLLPHHFALWEGYVNLLRLVALRGPPLFLREFSGPIGAALTERLSQTFEAAGFRP